MNRARCPLAPQAEMPVLLFRLHPIADADSFSFRHWTKIGALRCRHPIRPCFIFFGRLRTELHLDKLTGAAFALDRNQQVALKRLRAQRGFAGLPRETIEFKEKEA